MKLQTICLISAMFLAGACAMEEDIGQPLTEEEAGEEYTGPVMEPGVSIVKVSGHLAERIEAGGTETFAAAGVSSVEHLFTIGGEFEARQRKAGLHRWYVLRHSAEMPRTKASESLYGIDGVELVEGQRKITISGFDDFNENYQWHYSNGSGHASINVQPVWNNYTTGKNSVIVGVVDGGIDLSHEDLAAACTGVRHRNFVFNSSTITADDHGTHVGGTIGAINNNGTGVCGIAGGDASESIGGVRLMSCQIFQGDKGGSGADAMIWAADNGAVICQNSWGYDFDYDGDGVLNPSEQEAAIKATASEHDKAAIDYFIKNAGCDNDGNQKPDSPMKGGVVIFAAGNDGLPNGAPANYPPVIAVGALDKNGNRADYSNYGAWVDIAAPGTDIYSTYPDNRYGTMTGTSMACPHVSGIAALIVSRFGGPGFTNSQLEEKLIKGADHDSNPTSQIGPVADACGSMTYGNDKAPEAVTDMQIAAHSNFLDISFTATGDSEGVPAYGYTVFYGTDRTGVENTTAGQPADGVGFMSAFPEVRAGEFVSFTISGLDFNETYYLKMFAFSYGSSYSEATDVKEVTTGANTAPVIATDYTGSTSFKPYEKAAIDFTVSDSDGHDIEVEHKQGSPAEEFMTMPDGRHRLTITASNAETGNYETVITVKDSYGMSSSYKFAYTILDNAVPEVAEQIGDMLFDKSPASFTLDMNRYFSDSDGEQLTYEVSSSDNSVAFLNPNGDRIIGTVLKYGRADITITARDAKGTSASQSFSILARPGDIGFTAYPNPVVDTLHVATGEEPAETDIAVYNAAGAVVFSGRMLSSAFDAAEVDMSSCAPGRYVVSVTYGGKTFKDNIVKL